MEFVFRIFFLAIYYVMRVIICGHIMFSEVTVVLIIFHLTKKKVGRGD